MLDRKSARIEGGRSRIIAPSEPRSNLRSASSTFSLFLPSLRLIEHPEKHRNGQTSDQINQRPQKRHRRNQIADDAQNSMYKIHRRQNRQQKHSDESQSCCILQCHGRSMAGLNVGSKCRYVPRQLRIASLRAHSRTCRRPLAPAPITNENIVFPLAHVDICWLWDRGIDVTIGKLIFHFRCPS